MEDWIVTRVARRRPRYERGGRGDPIAPRPRPCIGTVVVCLVRLCAQLCSAVGAVYASMSLLIPAGSSVLVE